MNEFYAAPPAARPNGAAGGHGPGRTIIEALHPGAILQGENFRAIERFIQTRRHRQLGWHYVVDLVWILGIVRNWPARSRVLDVGGGSGPLQYLLAELGFDVTNVDLVPARLQPWLKRRYRATLNESAAYVPTDYVGHLQRQAVHWGSVASKLSLRSVGRSLRDAAAGQVASRHYDRWRRSSKVELPVGSITLVKGNICSLPEMPSASFDAVVSLSALEHIPIQQIPAALGEIERVLKPGGAMAITTSGTHLTETWLHEPSRGLCFSVADASRIFKGTFESPLALDEVLQAYQENVYLRRNLAGFYFKSAENGMPNGLWSPSYIPIGVRR